MFSTLGDAIVNVHADPAPLPAHTRESDAHERHQEATAGPGEREGLPLATVGTWLRRGREELRRGMGGLLDELGRGTS